MKQILKLPKDHPVIGPALHAGFQSFQYSPAVIASGRLLFMAGQVGIAPDGEVPEDPSAQAEIAFACMGALLTHAGLDFSDLVDLTTYLVDLPRTMPATRTVKERFITGSFPPWTIIGVSALGDPRLLLEVKGVAAFRD